MAEYIPASLRTRAQALPPASDIIDSPVPTGAQTLLFVGGVGAYYRLHECARGVNEAEDARLILCTREDQWQGVRAEYEGLIEDRVEVVHRSGAELEELYARTDFGSLFLEPITYREFAAPLKMFEYLGHGKPIISAEGSLASEFVQQHGIGWVIPYQAAALSELLDRLAQNPDEVAAVRARVADARQKHTWPARARQVADDLRGLSVNER
jgi:glycosyltransferase involved in cell wall biosynthesis